MGHLTLVRHGQASLRGDHYDSLSDLGRDQARLLGAHWARLGVRFDRAWVGPRQRHRQTAVEVARAYADAGVPFPDPVAVGSLDEHDGIAVLKRAAGLDEPGDRLMTGDPARDAALRQALERYPHVMAAWSAGAYAEDGIEPWHRFRARAGEALEHLRAEGGRGVAFTSGGVVAAVVGAVLELGHEHVIALSASVYNSALTDLHHRPEGTHLTVFNATPHLSDPRHLTRL